MSRKLREMYLFLWLLMFENFKIDIVLTVHRDKLYMVHTKEWRGFKTRNLLLTLHGQNVHRQQRQLSKFLMRYQQFASHAYCGAAGSVSKMA